MIHASISIYANGEQVLNGVRSEDLASHISFNLSCRWGRALIVDGHLITKGYLDISECQEIIDYLREHPYLPTEITEPYK